MCCCCWCCCCGQPGSTSDEEAQTTLSPSAVAQDAALVARETAVYQLLELLLFSLCNIITHLFRNILKRFIKKMKSEETNTNYIKSC